MMMYGTLYQYFILHKQLNVPGIGTFQLERKPAVSDFPNKLIYPPSYAISLHHSNASPAMNFFGWLGKALDINDREAVIRFNDFAFELKRKILSGDRVKWDGVGTLSSGLAGEIRFESAFKEVIAVEPVKAEKVIRDKSEHTVRVGEDEKTSAEMLEYLNQPAEQKNYWWAMALAIGLLTTMFLGWYFSNKGLSVDATGVSKKIAPVQSTPTYRTVP